MLWLIVLVVLVLHISAWVTFGLLALGGEDGGGEPMTDEVADRG